MSELEKWERRHMEAADLAQFVEWLRDELHVVLPPVVLNGMVLYDIQPLLCMYMGINYLQLLKERDEVLKRLQGETYG